MNIRDKLVTRGRALDRAIRELRDVAESAPAPHVQRLLRIAEDAAVHLDAIVEAVEEQDSEEAAIDAEATAFVALQAGMKWKLYTRDANVAPPAEGHYPYDTREDALNAACNIKGRRLEVLHIIGPNNERIEADEIRSWCRARPS